MAIFRFVYCELKNWCLEPIGWKLERSSKEYDISKLQDTAENREKIFYKQMLIEGYDDERDITFNQTLIVTYSLKYKAYQHSMRNRQTERAIKYLNNPTTPEAKQNVHLTTFRIMPFGRWLMKSAVLRDSII